MRTFVIGSKELSCHILDELIDQGHDVLGVYARDDEPGMKVWHELGHRSLAAEASRRGIPVHYKMKVNSPESLALLKSLRLDVILSCFWSELFKEALLGLPAFGVYNLHTAYLPFNRGSRPIPWSLIKGEPYTGITLHKMHPGVDDGPIVDQEKVTIEATDTARSLYDKVTLAGKEVLKRTLPRFADGSVSLQPQDSENATYQLRGEPFGGQVDFFWDEVTADRFIRAMHFPPFRAHRFSPLHHSSPELCIAWLRKDPPSNDMFHLELTDPTPFRSRLTGGDRTQRSTLRSMLSGAQGKVVRLDAAVELNEHFPILEAIQRSGGLAVASRQLTECPPPSLRESQPFRYHNGVLEIPVIRIQSLEQCLRWVAWGTDQAQMNGHRVYLNLLLDGPSSEECLRILSQENLTSMLRQVGLTDVCNEFDTAYENFSA